MSWPRRIIGRTIAVVGWMVPAGLGAGCAEEPSREVGANTSEPVAAEQCLVRLHGKGGGGGPSVVSEDVAELFPDGNADGWGGRQWLYFPDDRYREAVDTVTTAIDLAGCSAVAIDGFSNGAAFAAKMYCRGESFDDRLLGVVIDDPVPDLSTTPCAPATGVEAALYWTTGLDAQATAGADCAPIDWTCEGGTMIGIDAYAASLGLGVQPSPYSDHQWFLDPPELELWLQNSRGG